LAFYRLTKYKKDAIAFSIIFYLICLSLFSNIPFLMSGILAERFIYFASLGFTLFIGLIISKLTSTSQNISFQTFKKPVIAITTIYVLVLMCISYSRNTEWKDSMTLFSRDLPKFPENSRLLCFLGSVKSIDEATAEQDQAKKLQIQKDAVDLLKRSLQISPDYFECHTELGQTYFKMGLLDSAEIEDRIALQLKPNDLLSLNELAGIAFKRKDFKTSLYYCRKVLQIDDKYVTTLSNISLCLAIDEKFDSAIYILRKAMVLDPEYNANNINMAIVYKIMNQFDSSEYYEKKAQIVNPAFHLNYSK
jgi:protein O-mannosyl-transferase